MAAEQAEQADQGSEIPGAAQEPEVDWNTLGIFKEEGATEAPAAEPEPEPAPEPEPEPEQEAKPSQDDEYASRFAALSREERRVRQERETAKAELSELQELRDVKKALASFRNDPKAVLDLIERESGVEHGYNHLTEAMLNDGKVTAEQQIGGVEQRLASVEASLKAREEALEVKERQRHVDDFKGDINKFIDENKETAPIVAKLESMEMVYGLIDSNYAETGEIMPIEKAVSQVESHLEQQAADVLTKLVDVPSIREKLVAALGGEASASEQPEASSTTTKASTPTLTNKLAAEQPPKSGNGYIEDEEESKAAAASLLRWTE